MVMQLKGKVCIVTGASSGIGEATALGLGALGASVVAVMRGQSPKAESAIRQIEARSKNGGGSFSAIYADSRRSPQYVSSRRTSTRDSIDSTY